MNRLILIGNGFDLAHKLKTKYEDFLWNALYQDLTNDDVGNRMFSQQNNKLEISFLNQIHEQNISSDFKFNKVIERISTLPANSKLKRHTPRFLNKLDQFNVSNWVDFEYVYFKLLEEVEEGKNPPETVRYYLNQINKELDVIKDRLVIYLKGINKDKIERSEIRDVFNSEIKSHSVLLQKSEFKQSIANKVLYLNFNYTNTVNQYSRSIVNIHGSLGSIDNPIIFGWGDDMHELYSVLEERNERGYLINSKSILYHNAGNYQKVLNFINEGSFEVQILGHSCGMSDRTLLSQVFKHENCLQIVANYYRSGRWDDFQDRVTGISRCFKEKSDFNSKMVNKGACMAID